MTKEGVSSFSAWSPSLIGGDIAMTKEEAKSYYKKYKQNYDDAKTARSKAENNIATYTSKRVTAENSLSFSKSQKKNLEARLADIKTIISLLENSVPSHIRKANSSAETAGDKYAAAIKCSSIISASISSAYYTSSVTQDSNSAHTYQSCLDERTRLENDIENLRIQINNLNSKISALEANIRVARLNYSTYDSDMKSYKDKAAYYYSYL